MFQFYRALVRQRMAMYMKGIWVKATKLHVSHQRPPISSSSYAAARFINRRFKAWISEEGVPNDECSWLELLKVADYKTHSETWQSHGYDLGRKQGFRPCHHSTMWGQRLRGNVNTLLMECL